MIASEEPCAHPHSANTGEIISYPSTLSACTGALIFTDGCARLLTRLFMFGRAVGLAAVMPVVEHQLAAAFKQ